MNVNQIMSTRVVSVTLDDPLSTVKEIFDQAHFHHLLVIEGKKLIGVLSDRDLFKAISPNVDTNRYTAQDMATLKKRVHQIVTRKPITLNAEASILDAIAIFNTHRISCIPIVDEDNIPIGILSWRDILKNIADVAKEF